MKVEGDGATPVGIWTLQQGYYRGDRLLRPASKVPFLRLQKGWGWCETVGDRNYNRKVAIPYPTAHEELRRRDHLYDIVVETSHNRRPRIQGRGSAIFFHLAQTDFRGTAGCIALSLKDMRKVLAFCSSKTALVIWPPGATPPNVFRK
jgi:L,D-peptidoglycan transpeptidase YkuD (ErfK/YbiS/YcfS/YnhG family)